MPVGFVSKAMTHKTVDEIWYCLEGKGTLVLKDSEGGTWKELEFTPGVSVSIPVATYFQTKNIGQTRLKILGITSPRWPMDPFEAMDVKPIGTNNLLEFYPP